MLHNISFCTATTPRPAVLLASVKIPILQDHKRWGGGSGRRKKRSMAGFAFQKQASSPHGPHRFASWGFRGSEPELLPPRRARETGRGVLVYAWRNPLPQCLSVPRPPPPSHKPAPFFPPSLFPRGGRVSPPVNPVKPLRNEEDGSRPEASHTSRGSFLLCVDDSANKSSHAESCGALGLKLPVQQGTHTHTPQFTRACTTQCRGSLHEKWGCRNMDCGLEGQAHLAHSVRKSA